MKQEIYLFGIILILMTLISSLGGAIRYEENFYNEVFDLNDEVTVPSKESNLPQGNDESLMSEANVPSAVVPDMRVEEEIDEVEPQPRRETENNEEDISAYEDGQYATF